MRKLREPLYSELSLTTIDDYYERMRKAIEVKYSDSLNLHFYTDFMGLPPSLVEKERDEAYAELEKEATLCLLSYMESIFRIDFAMRCELKQRDDLARLFRKAYKPTNRIYQYSFKDVVIHGWKEIHPEAADVFNRINEMMNYRHWLAHGRYWVFPDNPMKYTYLAIHRVVELFEKSFDAEIRRPLMVGTPIP